MFGRTLSDVPWEELRTNIRHEISHGLRNTARFEPELLVTAADVVLDALVAGEKHVLHSPNRPTTATATLP